MLRRDGLAEYLPARRLLEKVARSMAERARQQTEAGYSSAGWRELETAASLGGAETQVDEVRRGLLKRAFDRIEQLLLAGELRQAREYLDRIERHHSHDGRSCAWQSMIDGVGRAQRQQRWGDFAEAARHWKQAEQLAVDLNVPKLATFLEEQGRACIVNDKDYRRLTQSLHRMLAAEDAMKIDWTEVLATSESILALATDCVRARAARSRAWEVVGLRASRGGGQFFASVDRMQRPMPAHQAARRTARRESEASQVDTVSRSANIPSAGGPRSNNRRLMIWVDGVGGFLTLVGERFVIGQPSSEGAVDLAIRADLSRRHCVVQRSGEGYWIEPVHALSGTAAEAGRQILVAGRAISGPTLLANGNVIDLGRGVQMVYRRPHALSASARLDVASHHKTQPTADGVLLMSDTCILGPHRHCHIVCSGWQHDVLLYRQGEQLFCRAKGRLMIDGQPCDGQGIVGPDAHIEGEDFVIRLEVL